MARRGTGKSMRVLIVADEEAKALWDYYDPARVEGVELILSCGDLNSRYLEFLVTMVNCPLLYVHGNHDNRYDRQPPEGCIDIEDRIVSYKGLRILGLGGSMRYKEGPHMYTEGQMYRRVLTAGMKSTFTNGFDILLTHAPARGWRDMEDLPHRGFECFNQLLDRWKPAYMLHGHVHQTYSYQFQRETVHSSGTRIINGFGYHILDIPEEIYSGGRRGFFSKADRI